MQSYGCNRVVQTAALFSPCPGCYFRIVYIATPYSEPLFRVFSGLAVSLLLKRLTSAHLASLGLLLSSSPDLKRCIVPSSHCQSL